MMVMKLRPMIALASLAAVTLGAGLAAAQDNVSALKGHDSKAPIDLSADRAEAQDRVDRAIFAGNVIVRQGSLTLRTARLTLAYASQDGIDINRIDASGGVTVTSYPWSSSTRRSRRPPSYRVAVSPSGSKIRSRRRVPTDRPVTRCRISPSTR